MKIHAIAILSLALGLTACSNSADTKTASADAKYDPKTMCPVSGEKLGEMGEPYVLNYNGRQIKLCCSNCEADFRKDPQKYIAKLDGGSTTQPSAK